MGRRIPWVPLALVAVALVVVLYFPVLKALVDQWWDDDNYTHGFLVPLISGFLIYRRWDELKSSKPGGGTALGVALIALSAIFLVFGTAAAELMTSRLSLPTFLIGASLVFLGRDFTRRAALIPLPYIIYYKIAFPLQLLSAKVAAGILDLLGVSIIRQGNVLHLPDYVLEVVAACSGLRSLMTMVTLALVMGALARMSIRNRVVLVLFAVPAAIAANTLRLVVTGLGAYLVSSSFADGFLHGISGMVVFVSGLAVLLSVFAILRRMG
jgi:exosortase